jgi:hypothetical protein
MYVTGERVAEEDCSLEIKKERERRDCAPDIARKGIPQMT